MDHKKIFKLFDFNSKPSNFIGDDVDNFRETPRYKVGMFSKLIINGVHFTEKLSEFLLKANEELDAHEVEEAGRFMMFSRAYFWVKEFDVEDEEWVEAVNFYTDDSVNNALSLSIDFFISIEEYEKCRLLSDIREQIIK